MTRISGAPPSDPAGKIMPMAVAMDRFGPTRSHTLVFTNGCFDLLHRGHVEYLTRARRLGDALLVGVNTDASVRRIKEEGRPLSPEDDRAFVVAGLESVDAVVLFDEDTPRALIAALVPDVLVKGGDYRPDEIVGRDAVIAAGGRVEVLPFLEGRSTTQLIDRIRGDA